MATFKILSIDGGGIRGIMSAAFLEEMETGRPPLRTYFDMVAGTSTGSIIALAIAIEKPMSEIVSLYRDRGEAIFKKRLLRGPYDAFGSKYVNKILLEELHQQFGDTSLERAKCMVCVPSADLVVGTPKIFQTKNTKDDTATDVLIREVAAASSAAPLYFPTYEMQNRAPNPPNNLHKKAVGGIYVDGGVWANNPAMIAIAEAIRIGIPLSDIRVLAVSTGNTIFQVSKGTSLSGLISWRKSLIDLTFQTQSQGVDILARNMCGERYHRVTWDLTEEHSKLDAVKKIPTLEYFGRQKAEEKKQITRLFLAAVAPSREERLARG